MPNPKGNNGYGQKNYPPDDVLKATLLKYAERGYSRSERLSRLQIDHQLAIGTTKLGKLERQFNIPSVRHPPPIEVSRQAVIDEVEKDVTQGNGPTFVKGKLKNKGLQIPRDTVRQIMHEEFPDGFAERFPGQKKNVLKRVALSSIGPFHEVSADGHEKLSHQALQMGEIGLPIYAYKDKWSDYLFLLRVVPDARTPGTIGHLFLDFVQEMGAVPVQMTTDKGSEIGWQYAIQATFRNLFAPDIDIDTYPDYVILKSVNNTIIEGFWRWLRMKTGHNLKDNILKGKKDHIFNPIISYHKDLFNWIFPTLVQKELDEFRTWWNQHRVRTQPDKNMPSGHIPVDAFEHPGLHGGLDCRIRVSQEAVDSAREYLTEEVGPRDDHFAWVSEEFAVIAEDVFRSIGSPEISFRNAWKVFSMMSDAMA